MQAVPMPTLPPVDPPKAVQPPIYQKPTLYLPEPDYPELPVPEESSTAPSVDPFGPAPISNPPVMFVPPDPIVVIGAHRLPNTADYYPLALLRAGIEGAADVRVCVDASGRLQGSPMIQRSSGNADFDRAATKVTRDGRYARSLQGGRPVPNCHAFRIIFDVND